MAMSKLEKAKYKLYRESLKHYVAKAKAATNPSEAAQWWEKAGSVTTAMLKMKR